MDVKLKFEKIRDFDVMGVQNLSFPIDFARGPYRSAAQTNRLCFHRRYLVSLFVSRIKQKTLYRFSRKTVEKWHMGQEETIRLCVVIWITLR